MTRPIVHVCNTPTPYRIAEWDTAAADLGAENLALVFADTHYHTACWRPVFPARCNYYTIGGTAEEHGITSLELPAVLDRLNPRMVILSGYRTKPYWIARRWCRRHRVPYCMRSASNYHVLESKGFINFRSFLRWFFLSSFVRGADKCLVTGTSNRKYWQHFGMKPSQEGWFPQWINHPLYSQARELRRTQRDKLRQSFGIQMPIAVFTAGRMLWWKRVDLLCEAMLRLDDRMGLVVAGHGPEETMLRERYASRLGDRLMFVGDIDPTELPQWYAATDIYALASGPHEEWGHVVTESATGGMPIVLHELTGAAIDLVRDGVNGFVLKSFDPDDWATALRRFADEPDLIAKMGAQASRIADEWQAQGHPTDCLRTLLGAYA